jgi:hypothetical protein
MTSIERTVSDRIARSGYAHLSNEFFGQDDPKIQEARRSFARSCRALPIDIHGDNANRTRRFGNFILLPWNGAISAVPPVWDAKSGRMTSRYLQSAAINPEQNGDDRKFASLTKAQAENVFLQFAIARCFRSLPWRHPRKPVGVGCHIIRLTASPGNRAVSSPDLIHRDGEPFTFAALIERHGVTGGENLITIPEAANKHPSEVRDEAVIDRFTLDRPWDGWVVDDRAVAHYVSPVEVAEGYRCGSRTILLIDFTPLVPNIVL